MEVRQRDEQRQRDLATLAEALQRYYRRHGTYPATRDVQSFCVFRGLDVGCRVDEVLDPIPQDPAHGATYYYLSDGTSFVLFATLEGAPVPSQCPDPVPPMLPRDRNIYCVQGRPENSP